MFGWLKQKQVAPLASAEERESILSKQHPLFRVVDAGFHAYMAILSVNPDWDDARIEKKLRAQVIDPGLAEDLVAFAPLAFGRDVIQQLGVKYSDQYKLHSLTDGTTREMSLGNELAYAWARAMIEVYRTPERNELFKFVCNRSAELAAINSALHAGISANALREGSLDPVIVNLRWRRSFGPAPQAQKESADEGK
jgi:hypothetical protein